MASPPASSIRWPSHTRLGLERPRGTLGRGCRVHLLSRPRPRVPGPAVAGGALARLAGQPLILGYVLGGILISPLTLGPSVSDLHTFELFAEIGVILLMFSIGIEFSLRDLLRVKWVALLGGPLGIVISTGLGLAVAW